MVKQSEDKLDFLAATIHDLKTFLTAIIVSAELLDDELKPGDKTALQRLIQSIIRNAHSIDERLSELGTTSGLLVVNSRFKPESVELGPVVRNVTAQLYPEIQSKRQSLTVEVPDFLPPVRADRQYLEQILLTLVANASKFTPEEGQIRVSVGQDDDNLIVQVSDTGIGVPVEEQEKIFQPYYQVGRSPGHKNVATGEERKHTDSGLGLAIAKFLVELHEGKIWLKSTVEQGSSFFFSLPKVVSVESSRN